MYVLVLNLLDHVSTVFEAELICRSHFSGSSLAHAVEYLMEYIDLFLAQRIFKRYTELVEIVRKLGGVNITLALVVNHINHRYISFQIQYYRKKTA